MQPTQTTNQTNVETSSRIDSVVLPLVLEGRISESMWHTFTLEQQDLLKSIDTLPKQLLGTVPESVWSTLNIDQKLEFLFSNGILPRVGEGSVLSQENQASSSSEANVGADNQLLPEGTNFVEISGEVAVNEKSEVQQEFEQVKEEINKIESESKVDEGKMLPPEDLARIEAESGATFSKPTPRFSGYQPSDDLVQNADDRALNGDPRSSSTWAALLLKKFWDALS